MNLDDLLQYDRIPKNWRNKKEPLFFRKMVIMSDIQQKGNKNPIYLQLQYNCFFHHYSFGSLPLFTSPYVHSRFEQRMCGLIKELYVFSLLQEKNIPNAYFYTIEKIIKDLLGEYSMIFTTIAFIAFSQRYEKYSFSIIA